MTPSSRTKVQRSAPVRKALTPLEQLQQQAKQMKHG
jgi:hypothetical protein